jgi:hypothetical protein
MNDQDALKEAVKRLHVCDAKFIESVDVVETFRGQTVWAGSVSVFDLIGHPKAKRCYAWNHKDGKDDKQTRFVAVLELPPVNSPLTAVRAAIVSQHKKNDVQERGTAN